MGLLYSYLFFPSIFISGIYIYEKAVEVQKALERELVRVNEKHKDEHACWDQEKEFLNTQMIARDQQFQETNRTMAKVKFTSQILFCNLLCCSIFFFFYLNRIQYSLHPRNEQHYYYFSSAICVNLKTQQKFFFSLIFAL